MPATNFGPPPQSAGIDPAVLDQLSYQDDDAIADAIADFPYERQQSVLVGIRAARDKRKVSDTKAAEEADTQTWQASLGTDRFRTDQEAPVDLQVLINQTENPQQLRETLQSITDTGRTPETTLGVPGKGLYDVPQGTKFSVREAQNGGGVDVVYQRPGETEWSLYDPPGLSGRNILAWLQENLTMGNLTSMGADAVVTSKLGPVGRLATSALTAAGGRVIDEVREPGTQSAGEIANKGLESAGGGLVGSVLGDVGGAVGNALTGRGFSATSRTAPTELQLRARDAQTALERQKWDPLTLGETGLPVYASAANVAAATGTEEAARRERRLAQPLAALRGEAGPETLAEVPLDVLQEVRDYSFEEARKEFSAGVAELGRSGVVDVNATPERFGRRLYRHYGDFLRAEKAITGKEFTAAQEQAVANGVVFNLQPFKDTVNEFKEFAELRGFPEEETANLGATTTVVPGTPARQELVGTDRVPTSIGVEVPVDVTRTVPGTPNRVVVEKGLDIPIGERETIVNWAQGYRPAFRQLFKIVDDLNPEQPAEFLAGIRRVQTWLGALSEPGPGGMVDPEAIRVAAALSASLDEAMRASPGASEYFKNIDTAKNHWANILRMQRSMDLFAPTSDRTMSYGERAYRAFSGGDSELLTEQGALAAFKILSSKPGAIEEFRGAIARDALRDPSKINNLLQTADRLAALPNGRELFPVSLRNQLEAYQARLANADFGQIDAQIKAFQSGAQTARTMIDRGNVEEIKMLLRQKVWTQDQLRGYVLTQLADRSEQTGATRGAQLLDPEKYQKELRRLEAAGILDLLPAKTQQLLEDVETVTQFIRTSTDIGSGMAAGTINQRRAQNLPINPVAIYGTLKAKQVAIRAWLGSRPNFVALMGFGTKPPRDWRMTREVLRLATEAIARSNLRPDLSQEPTTTAEEPQ